MKKFNEAVKEILGEGKYVPLFAELSVGNTYLDNNGWEVKVTDIGGTGSNMKITLKYDDGKTKTISGKPDKKTKLTARYSV